MQFYDRIYYTLYRALISFGQINEIDIPRSNTAILLTLLTELNVVGILTLLSGITGSDVITGSKVQSIFVGVFVVIFNFCLIFYKRRYKKIEDKFSATWGADKYKNILLTLTYIIFTALFLLFSFKYARSH